MRLAGQYSSYNHIFCFFYFLARFVSWCWRVCYSRYKSKIFNGSFPTSANTGIIRNITIQWLKNDDYIRWWTNVSTFACHKFSLKKIRKYSYLHGFLFNSFLFSSFLFGEISSCSMLKQKYCCWRIPTNKMSAWIYLTELKQSINIH